MKSIDLLNRRKPLRGFLLFLLIMLSQVACVSTTQNTPYSVDASFYYEVTIVTANDSAIIDTLNLKIKKKGILGSVLGMNMAIWTSLTDSTYQEKRGINLSDDEIEIQTPLKLNYLDYEEIVIAGYPRYSKIMKPTFTSEANHKFIKGYGMLSGKNLKQSSIILDSVICFYKNIEYLCKVAESQNENYIDAFGRYQMKTYFHEKYGFLRLEYLYPSDKRIIFRLVDIKNEP
jgi:hypothetical protein